MSIKLKEDIITFVGSRTTQVAVKLPNSYLGERPANYQFRINALISHAISESHDQQSKEFQTDAAQIAKKALESKPHQKIIDLIIRQAKNREKKLKKLLS